MTAITIPASFPSQADPAAFVTGPEVRFTVLTSRLIRMEYSQSNAFEDRASQAFWYRRQPIPPFRSTQASDGIEIETEHLLLRYRVTEAGFTAETLSVLVKELGVTWRLGDRDRRNLRGTARTLDKADGEIPLEPGLMSRAGWSLVDDSASLVFNQDWLAGRTAPGSCFRVPGSVFLRPRPRLHRLSARLHESQRPRAHGAALRVGQLVESLLELSPGRVA